MENYTQPDLSPKPKRRWLKYLLIFLGVIAIAILALFVLSRPLPAGSDAIKNRALNTLMEKGEEVFMENGVVTENGLCVFMIFNASYLEAVSDPEWEFQCFDSANGFAGEVKLNSGKYRCKDSSGNDVKAERSIIYGDQCLEPDDPRLDDNQKFETTNVFFKSDRVAE